MAICEPISASDVFMSEDELQLRRNLLFRLLRRFDFDAPENRYEPLAAAVDGWQIGEHHMKPAITSAA